LAVKYTRYQAIKILLTHHADVNIRNHNGCTPLHIAAAQGNGEIVGWLLGSGANVYAKDKRGRVPLHLAVESGSMPCVQYIVLYNANVNAQDNQGYTPLHYATSMHHLDIIKYLAENKSSFFIKNASHCDVPDLASALVVKDYFRELGILLR
jgi:ankyrin repeat protein